jgi:hypothetical protein
VVGPPLPREKKRNSALILQYLILTARGPSAAPRAREAEKGSRSRPAAATAGQAQAGPAPLRGQAGLRRPPRPIFCRPRAATWRPRIARPARGCRWRSPGKPHSGARVNLVGVASPRAFLLCSPRCCTPDLFRPWTRQGGALTCSATRSRFLPSTVRD